MPVVTIINTVMNTVIVMVMVIIQCFVFANVKLLITEYYKFSHAIYLSNGILYGDCSGDYSETPVPLIFM